MSRLKVTEAFCYICRGVLIEPVTAPCSHVFCYNCFEQSMQETSHSCPLCRKRISNWIRSVKKSNKLVDTKLWEKIKEQFKEQVRLKLNGEDDGLDQYIQSECEIIKPISKSGEVAQEFSKLLNDFRSEREKVKQAEELASKELIEKLKEEEEERLRCIKEKNMKILKEDEKLALRMQEMERKTPENNSSKEKTQKGEKERERMTPKGPMDDFLKGLSTLNKRPTYIKSISQETEDEGEGYKSSASTDSLRMEMNLFRPIKKVLTTPPKQYPDGRIREINLTKVKPLKLTFNSSVQSFSDMSIIEGKSIRSNHSAFVDANFCSHKSEEGAESSPKRLKLSLEESDNGILKDITLGENNDSNSGAIIQEDEKRKKFQANKQMQENSFFSSLAKYHVGEKEDGKNDNFETQDYLNPSPMIEDKLIEEQRKIERIIIQEKKDRELALKLSQEWELESKRMPQTRSMLANAISKKNNHFKNTKSQKTLLESAAISSRRSRKK